MYFTLGLLSVVGAQSIIEEMVRVQISQNRDSQRH